MRIFDIFGFSSYFFLDADTRDEAIDTLIELLDKAGKAARQDSFPQSDFSSGETGLDRDRNGCRSASCQAERISRIFSLPSESRRKKGSIGTLSTRLPSGLFL